MPDGKLIITHLNVHSCTKQSFV